MKILIVGAGVVGSNLAAEISKAGHEVSVIDSDRALVRQLNDRLDVLAIDGNGAQPSVLRRAGIEETEMVIAVTNTDEVNLVICMLAERFGVKHKIARIRNDEYSGPDSPLKPEELGIDRIINPEQILCSKLLRILDTPGSTDIADLAGGQVLLVTFDISDGAPVAGKRLREVRELAESLLVVAIFHGERPVVPRGDDEIRAGDHVAVMVHRDDLEQILPLMQEKVTPAQRVVVYGGLVGRPLARALEERPQKVVLIEPDEAVAERLAADLREALVLRGEATEPEILREADLQHCDYFFALSGSDEANLLAGLMARRHGARRVAVLAQQPSYVPIMSSIGMDVVINPRLASVGEILCYLRQGHVHSVTRLTEAEAEVIELSADEGAKITKKPLRELDIPNGSLIGAVLREGQMVIPDGNMQIRAGETVLVFALPDAIREIGQLFSR